MKIQRIKRTAAVTFIHDDVDQACVLRQLNWTRPIKDKDQGTYSRPVIACGTLLGRKRHARAISLAVCKFLCFYSCGDTARKLLRASAL